MAKKAPVLEVYLRNDWYDGGSLLRPAGNPHSVPESKIDFVPDSAKVKIDDAMVSLGEFRKKRAEEVEREEPEKTELPSGALTDPAKKEEVPAKTVDGTLVTGEKKSSFKL